MSDYLGQLVLRIRQPDVAVQPRLPSRFEPPHHVTFDALDLSTSGETEAPSPPASAVIPFDSGTVASAQQADQRSPREPGTADALLEARSARNVPTPHSGELMEAPPMVAPRFRRETAHQPVREVDHPTADGRPEPGELQSQRVIEAVKPETRVERPAATVRRASSSAPVLEAPVEPIRRVVKAEEVQIRPMASLQEPDGPATGSPAKSESEESCERPRADGGVDLRPASDLVPTRSKALFRPRVSPAVTLPDADRAQGPDAPVIQVTIGRVEIRATVEPTPARKPPARSPAMSLDEYLKQRNEASRE